MFLRYSYTTLITFSAKVTDHAFAMRCTPVQGPGQRVVWQRLTVLPSCQLTSSSDAFGNIVTSGYLGRRHDLFAYEAAGVVETSGGLCADLPDPVYSYPSPLTMPDVAIAQLAACLGSPKPDVLRWVHSLMDALASQLVYAPGATSVDTTAAQALELHQGVCQDFAHVAVSVCRLAGLPARYVCGLMEGEGATHAWVEVFAGTHWLPFDPTNNRFVGRQYVKMAHGRDFADCSISRGVFRGVASQNVSVSVDVWKVSPEEALIHV